MSHFYFCPINQTEPQHLCFDVANIRRNQVSNKCTHLIDATTALSKYLLVGSTSKDIGIEQTLFLLVQAKKEKYKVVLIYCQPSKILWKQKKLKVIVRWTNLFWRIIFAYRPLTRSCVYGSLCVCWLGRQWLMAKFGWNLRFQTLSQYSTMGITVWNTWKHKSP